ncbi:hypothetical protein B9G99_12765 [Kushneria konosiri]|uniref:Uncharacterized protein n=1 Tax=Kushneria konosiri TaxID=698828 RepID=A0A2Z2H830_9GAMM|nr:hypothetical protein B9G99_12765 [Kushneria konosiri]
MSKAVEAKPGQTKTVHSGNISKTGHELARHCTKEATFCPDALLSTKARAQAWEKQVKGKLESHAALLSKRVRVLLKVRYVVLEVLIRDGRLLQGLIHKLESFNIILFMRYSLFKDELSP